MQMTNKTSDKVKKTPTIAELLTTSISERTKWNRSKAKKLSKKVYVARFIYLDETAKRREKTKEFTLRKDADDWNREQRIKYERSGGREIEAEKMTFADLARHYEKHYAKAAEYLGERKTGGLRSVRVVKNHLAVLREYFNSLKIKKITYGHLKDFRAARLSAPVVTKVKIKIPLSGDEQKKLKTRKKFRFEWQEKKHTRQIASVNRELALLRRMLNIAQAEGWIPKNPFNSGNSLINLSDETIRQRILSIEEERRLLNVCECDERKHLKSIIVCLLDTGMRLNEALTLTWNDVDHENSVINIKAFNTKTAKAKAVPISARLEKELLRLKSEHEFAPRFSSERVFGIKNNINRSWRTAKKLAGLEDLRLHDLRHTAGTRLNRQGLSQADIARILGHQQTSTTFRYINADTDLLNRAKSALESYHVEKPEIAENLTESIN